MASRARGSGDPRDARANAWGSVTAGKHWSCGVFGPGRRLACWGKKRAYAVGGAVADAYEEFGVVSFPRSPEAACARFLVVAAGTNHACAVTDERAHGENLYNGTDGTDDTALAASGDEVHRGGRMVCWGDASSGKTSPPKFVTAWRAWPTSAESADLGAAFAPSAFAATASDAVCGASVSGSAATATSRRATERRARDSVCVRVCFVVDHLLYSSIRRSFRRHKRVRRLERRGTSTPPPPSSAWRCAAGTR